MEWLFRQSSRQRVWLAALLAALSGGCASAPRREGSPVVVDRSPDQVNPVVVQAKHDNADPLATLESTVPKIQPAAYPSDAPLEAPAVVSSSPNTNFFAASGGLFAVNEPLLEDPVQLSGEVLQTRATADDTAAEDSLAIGLEATNRSEEDPPPASKGNGQSLDYFIETALLRHPKLVAANHRVAAAVNVVPQARALPDPTFNNTFWPIQEHALQTAGGRVGNQMSLNQTVPFPEKRKAKAAIAAREIQIAQAEADRIAREITESVQLAYYEVWFSDRAIAINDETQTLVADLIAVAGSRYRSGGSQQDVLRAQLESDRLLDQRITLQKQKRLAQADLATLLQQPVRLLPEVEEELQLNDTPQQIEALIALAEECNPTLRGLAWEVQRDRERQRLACLQEYPDFTVGLNWGLISDGSNTLSPVADGSDNLSVSFGTTLPIWREKIRAGVREASHRTSSTTRRLDAQRDELRGTIRRLLAQADALVEQRELYEQRIIPRTESTLQVAIADYRGKRTDFFSLIETYRELLMFETQLARIDATLAGTIAQLDRTVGCPK